MKIIQIGEKVFYNLEFYRSFITYDDFVIESDPITKSYSHVINLVFVGSRYIDDFDLRYSKIEDRNKVLNELLDFIKSNDAFKIINCNY